MRYCFSWYDFRRAPRVVKTARYNSVSISMVFSGAFEDPARAAVIGAIGTGTGAAAAAAISPEAVAFGICSLVFCGGGGGSIRLSTNSWYTKTSPSERRIASRSLLVSKRCLASDYSRPICARAGTGSYPWPPSGWHRARRRAAIALPRILRATRFEAAGWSVESHDQRRNDRAIDAQCRQRHPCRQGWRARYR